LTVYDAEGAFLRTEPNGGPAHFVTWPVGTRPTLNAIVDAAQGVTGRAPPKSDDDTIIETYLSHRNITGYDRREAETVWTLYKKLVGKPLKYASRDDGRALVKQFQDDGNKSATINKKVGWLRAACRLAIKEGKLKFNPFAEIVPESSDELERVPLSEADVKLCKRNLDKLSESDQLLLRVLGSTGMRLGEAYQINGEKIERGVRYVQVGTKTDASDRNVALPADLLTHLPKKIVGPLFAADVDGRFDEKTIDRLAKAASKRLNRFLDDCGLDDPSIVVHSLRHRAADRLRAYECPKDIRQAVLGHENGEVSEGYGEGFSVRQLRKWIDKIGF
jgi:integrase